MLLMGKVNSSLTRNDSMMHLATEPGTVRTFSDDAHANAQHAGKWPVWVRLLIIVSLSAALWAGIIAGIAAIF
ncbi:hypothetical protein HY3_15245 [Hyphomonas pacifica]|uniref:Uncharacterized protein n=1 Tax=Hyphomonas pacifica TaxID=1280941 RepID=A0A8B2PM00_9PROT|nr:hypothetical protein HY3_15245 [Hyphomonas pacifica]